MTLSTPFFIVIAVVLVLGVLKAVFSGRPYRSVAAYVRSDLFNSAEHAFLLALRREAPAHIAVLAKVRVADLIKSERHDIGAFNKIARKHVDFVLYHTQSRQVLIAVELDGPSHASGRAQASDQLKNMAFASARVRLVRVPVAGSENAETVRRLFQELRAESASKSSANTLFRADESRTGDTMLRSDDTNQVS